MTTLIYKFVPFLRSPIGRVLLLVAAVFTIAFGVREIRERQARPRQDTAQPFNLTEIPTQADTDTALTRIPVVINKDYSDFNPPKQEPKMVHIQPLPVREKPRSAPPPLVHFLNPAAMKEEPKNKEGEPAKKQPSPGSLVHCQLVNALSSEQANSPIIGIVRKALRVDNEIVIPASSRIYGALTQTEQTMRLNSANTWTVRTPLNEEIIFSGVAMAAKMPQLTQAKSPSGLSLGIPGSVRPIDKKKGRRAFLAAATGAIARTGRVGVETAFGFRSDRTLQNLGREAYSGIADQYSGNFFRRTENNEQIIDAPAGQYFYVFVAAESERSSVAVINASDLEEIITQRERLKALIGNRPSI